MILPNRVVTLLLSVAFICCVGFTAPVAAQSTDGTPVAEPVVETPTPEPATETSTETPTETPIPEPTEETLPDSEATEDLPSETATESPEPSSEEDAGDPSPTAEDDGVQAAAVSYDPVLQPFTVCDGAILDARWSVDTQIPWSNGLYLNTGDEPLLFEFELTDTDGNTTSVTSGPFEPGQGPAERLFTTVTALDVLNWELNRTVTVTVTGTVSGDELTETHQLSCPLAPAAFPTVRLTCLDDQGPYDLGDVYRLPVAIDNTFVRSSAAMSAFSLTTEDGTFEPAPPDSLAQDELVEIELLHVLTAEELDAGTRQVVLGVAYTFTWGPPAGSAAEGVLSPVSESKVDGVSCFLAGDTAATATPTDTPPTATPTEPSEPTPTSDPDPTSTPTATTPPDTEPTPRPTLRPTESPSQDEAPTPGTSKLPSAGTGGAVSGDGQPIGLVVLILTAFVLLGISRMRRPSAR